MSIVYFDETFHLCERTGSEGSYVYTPLDYTSLFHLGYPEIQDSVEWTTTDPQTYYCKILGYNHSRKAFQDGKDHPAYSSWSASTIYWKGDRVIYNGVIYECLQDAIGPGAWDLPPDDPRSLSRGVWKVITGSENDAMFQTTCLFTTDPDWRHNPIAKKDIITLGYVGRGVYTNDKIVAFLSAMRSNTEFNYVESDQNDDSSNRPTGGFTPGTIIFDPIVIINE